MSHVHYAARHTFLFLYNLIKAAIMLTLITRVSRSVNFFFILARFSLSLRIHPDPVTHDLLRIVRYSSKNVSAFYRPSRGRINDFCRNGSRSYNKLSHVSSTRIEVEMSDCAKTREV